VFDYTLIPTEHLKKCPPSPQIKK